jgi:hypothetical protein
MIFSKQLGPMEFQFKQTRLIRGLVAGSLLLVCLVGCSDPPEFRLNAVNIRLAELKQGYKDDEHISEKHLAEYGTLSTAFFGTPDRPAFPFIEEDDDLAHDLLKIENLRRAAGAVASGRDGKQVGLYREHCVHCHGISGGGDGPTATFLNPYPRDFRASKYKYKSTEIGDMTWPWCSIMGFQERRCPHFDCYRKKTKKH